MDKCLNSADTELEFLMKKMEGVAGEWDGKDSGLQEERSQLAGDIIEASDHLRGLLEDFRNL